MRAPSTTTTVPSLAILAALLVPGLALAGAYVAQYGFGLHPCEMCWWQRYPHFAALALAIGAWALRTSRPGVTRNLIVLAALATILSGLIGIFHAGVEYGWWEGLTRCSTTSGGSGDFMRDIMSAPIVRCDVPPFTVLGVSMAGMNALWSIGGGLAALFLLQRGRVGRTTRA